MGTKVREGMGGNEKAGKGRGFHGPDQVWEEIDANGYIF